MSDLEVQPIEPSLIRDNPGKILSGVGIAALTIGFGLGLILDEGSDNEPVASNEADNIILEDYLEEEWLFDGVNLPSTTNDSNDDLPEGFFSDAADPVDVKPPSDRLDCYSHDNQEYWDFNASVPRLWVGNDGALRDEEGNVYTGTSGITFPDAHKLDEVDDRIDSAQSVNELLDEVNYLVSESGVDLLFGSSADYPQQIAINFPDNPEQTYMFPKLEDMDRLRWTLKYMTTAVMTTPVQYWQSTGLETNSIFNAFGGLAGLGRDIDPDLTDGFINSHMSMKLLSPYSDSPFDPGEIMWHESRHGQDIEYCPDRIYHKEELDPELAQYNPVGHYYDNSEDGPDQFFWINEFGQEAMDESFVTVASSRALVEDVAEMNKWLYANGLDLPTYEADWLPVHHKLNLIAQRQERILPGMYAALVAMGNEGGLCFEKSNSVLDLFRDSCSV